ncbi:MAG: VOC family protein [Thermoleophilaceae bacterium]|nr:VOC family protein [Thermoleophilaceae bacterium]
MTVPARVSIVTLAARDVAALADWYERLGWRSHRYGAHTARFETGGAVLMLYDADKLAEEAGIDLGFGGATLALNVQEKDDVDAAMDGVRDAGGEVVREPADREWGGRSGYWADPEGNVWEVAWMPGGAFDERGAFIWPPR